MQPTTKIIIAGPRSFTNSVFVKNKLNLILTQYKNIEIVSGGAVGVDTIAINYAKFKGIKYTVFVPDYKLHHPRSAPVIRNCIMAKYSNVLIAFYNYKSKGTAHMITFARKYNLKVHIIYI